MVNSRCFKSSLLFRIVSSLNQFHLPLFMMNKVNVTLLRQFLGLYCLSLLIIWLTHYVFLISLLFRIVSSLLIHLCHDQLCKCYTIKTVFRFVLSFQAYYMVNS